MTIAMTLSGDVSDVDVEGLRTSISRILNTTKSNIAITATPASVRIGINVILPLDHTASELVHSRLLAAANDSTSFQNALATEGTHVTIEGALTPVTMKTVGFLAPSPPPPSPPPPSPPPSIPPTVYTIQAQFNTGYSWVSQPVDADVSNIDTLVPGLCSAGMPVGKFVAIQTTSSTLGSHQTAGCYAEVGSLITWLPPASRVQVDPHTYQILYVTDGVVSVTWHGTVSLMSLTITTGVNMVPYHRHTTMPINDALVDLLDNLNTRADKWEISVIVSAAPQQGYNSATYNPYLNGFMGLWEMVPGNGYQLFFESVNSSSVIQYNNAQTDRRRLTTRADEYDTRRLQALPSPRDSCCGVPRITNLNNYANFLNVIFHNHDTTIDTEETCYVARAGSMTGVVIGIASSYDVEVWDLSATPFNHTTFFQMSIYDVGDATTNIEWQRCGVWNDTSTSQLTPQSLEPGHPAQFTATTVDWNGNSSINYNSGVFGSLLDPAIIMTAVSPPPPSPLPPAIPPFPPLSPQPPQTPPPTPPTATTATTIPTGGATAAAAATSMGRQ
jgi:hypothetical protein